VENLFGQVRQHGVCNTHPTCHQFVAALKTVIINNFSSPFLEVVTARKITANLWAICAHF
jgi:hypothetical protein